MQIKVKFPVAIKQIAANEIAIEVLPMREPLLSEEALRFLQQHFPDDTCDRITDMMHTHWHTIFIRESITVSLDQDTSVINPEQI